MGHALIDSDGRAITSCARAFVVRDRWLCCEVSSHVHVFDPRGNNSRKAIMKLPLEAPLTGRIPHHTRTPRADPVHSYGATTFETPHYGRRRKPAEGMGLVRTKSGGRATAPIP